MMDPKHIPLEEATHNQLKWFATAILGIADLTGKENGVTLKAKIKQAWDKDSIFVMEPDPKYGDNPDSTGNPRNATMMEFPSGTGKMRECVRINIPIMDPKLHPGGDEDVKVSVNGTAMLIPRGQDVVVPVEYVEVLEHAVQFVYDEYDENSDMMGGLKAPRLVHNYQFNYVF